MKEQNYGKIIDQGRRFLKKQEAQEKQNAEWLKQLPHLVQCNSSHQTMMVIALLCMIAQIRAASFEPSRSELSINQTSPASLKYSSSLELAQLQYVSLQLQAKNEQFRLGSVSRLAEQEVLQAYEKERADILNQQSTDYRELKLRFQSLRKKQLEFNEYAQKLRGTETAILFKREWYDLQKTITVALSKLNVALFKKYTEIQLVFDELQNKKWKLIQRFNRPESDFSEEAEIMFVAQLSDMMNQIKEERLFFKQSVHKMLQGLFNQVAFRLEERKELIDPFFDTPEVNELYTGYQMVFNNLDQLHLSYESCEPEKKHLDLTKTMAELDEELPKVLINLTKQLSPFDQVLVFRTLKQIKSYDKLLFVGVLLSVLGGIGTSLFCMFRREPKIVNAKLDPGEQRLREEIHNFENVIFKFKNKLRKLMSRVESCVDFIAEEEFVFFNEKVNLFFKKFLNLQNDMIEKFNQFRENPVEELQGMIEISILKNRKNSMYDEYHQLLNQCVTFEAQKNRSNFNDDLELCVNINSEEKLRNIKGLDKKISSIVHVYESTFKEFNYLKNRIQVFEDSIPFTKKMMARLSASFKRSVTQKSDAQLLSEITLLFEKFKRFEKDISDVNFEKIDFFIQLLREKQEILNDQKQNINAENYVEKMQLFSGLNQEDKENFKTIQEGMKTLQFIFKKVEKVERQFFEKVDDLNTRLRSQEIRIAVACP